MGHITESEKSIVIVGAGRQGRNILEICRVSDRAVAGFLDDTKALNSSVNEVPVIGGLELSEDRKFVGAHGWIVGIGDNTTRSHLSEKIRDNGGELVTVIHPSCSVSASARVGEGVYINAFTKLLPNCHVSDFCLIEGPSSIGCDTFMGAACLIGPGAQLLGGAQVGDHCLIGAGTIICEDRRVGSGCRIGAGSVILKDIPDNTFAFGTPAISRA